MRRLLTVAAVALGVSCSDRASIVGDPVASTSAVPSGAAIDASARSHASATPSANAAKPVYRPAAVGVVGTLGTGALELSHGRAAWSKDNKLQVTFSSEPLPCGAKLDKDRIQWMELAIPPGPGAKYYVGGVIGLAVELRNEAAGNTTFGPEGALVTLSEVKPEDGGSVAGSVVVGGKASYGATTASVLGKFDVPVCGRGPDPSPAGIPEQAPPEPPAVQSAIALRDRDTKRISEIWMFVDASPGCGAARKPQSYAFYELVFFGNSRTSYVDARGPQPAELRFHPPVPDDTATGGSSFPESEAAISWSTFPASVGSEVRGRVMTPKGPYGDFVATVCP
jgi:hypothetical protein